MCYAYLLWFVVTLWLLLGNENVTTMYFKVSYIVGKNLEQVSYFYSIIMNY